MSALNVNLKPCTCGGRETKHSITGACSVMHLDSCPAAPVLIPCPFPRSVTFTVALGECTCDERIRAPRLATWQTEMHSNGCLARPIRVTCSISGKTWEESDVLDVEFEHENAPEDHARCEHLVAQRWALVKALVLGRACTPHDLAAGPHETVTDLFQQRDAVFAALADMARAESAAWMAQAEIYKALPSSFYIPEKDAHREPWTGPVAAHLERYVEHLIERVGVLP